MIADRIPARRSQPAANPRKYRSRSNAAGVLLGLLGALLGGVLGYFGFVWLTRQGLYSLVLPGAATGLGCGACSGRRSYALGAFCAAFSLGLALFAEWRIFPFAADESLAYFLSHLQDLKPITWVMIVVGALLAFWFGVGREGGVWGRRSKASAS